MIDERRVQVLKESTVAKGPIIYWMSRDQRVKDNWALLYAQEVARKNKTTVIVVFCVVDHFLQAPLRHYEFMLQGLDEVAKTLHKYNIPFHIVIGNPTKEIPRFIHQQKAAGVVTDFDPLKIKRQWKDAIVKKIDIPFWEVDAHNVVPCWIASGKQEYGAYTIRGKIHRLLPEFLSSVPELQRQKGKFTFPVFSKEKILKRIDLDRTVDKVDWIVPGEKAAHKMLKFFITTKLSSYNAMRNDPTLEGTSMLSPYLHFGQISAQRIALEVQKSTVAKSTKDAFLEELIVRKELSDNFCYYNQQYDSPEGFPAWAQKTLREHAKDKREYTYTKNEFEKGKTHDELWNAAQKQMVTTGRMHGYMRMYWCKKILEWTSSVEEAMKIAIYLNDKYQLDGRDPNGYVGIAWSLGGVHDRAWNERPIFGKIRFMSYNGCKSKFNVQKYIEKWK